MKPKIKNVTSWLDKHVVKDIFTRPTPTLEELITGARATVEQKNRYSRGKLPRALLVTLVIAGGLIASLHGICLLTNPPQEGTYAPTVQPISEPIKVTPELLGLPESTEKLTLTPTYKIDGLSSPASATYTGLGWGLLSFGVALIAIGIGAFRFPAVTNEELQQAHVFLLLTTAVSNQQEDVSTGPVATDNHEDFRTVERTINDYERPPEEPSSDACGIE